MIDYRASKVSNKTLKQGLMNRCRVWFERERVCFPYGDDATRNKVNTLLEELESHAWREGNIVDLGQHNDCAMAFAHAIDQFTYKAPEMPSILKAMNPGEWQGGTFSINRNDSSLGGRYIRGR